MGDQRRDSRKVSSNSGPLAVGEPVAAIPSGSPSPRSTVHSDDSPKSIPTQRKKSSHSVVSKKSDASSRSGPTENPSREIPPDPPPSSPPRSRRTSMALPKRSSAASIISLTSNQLDGEVRQRTQMEPRPSIVPLDDEPSRPAVRRRSSSIRPRKSSATLPGPFTFPPQSEAITSVTEEISSAPVSKPSSHKNSLEIRTEEPTRKSSQLSDQEDTLPDPVPDGDSNMPKQDQNMFRSSAQLSEPKRQKISELMAELKTVAGAEDEEISSVKDSKTSSQRDGLRESRSSSISRRPYNVIFESDEAASEATEARNLPGSRGRSSQLSSQNGERDSGNGNSVLLALRNWSTADDGELQKILDVWYGQLRQALVAENVTSRERILAEFDRSTRELIKSQQEDTERLHADIDSLHNLCRSYSKAIHERDRTIANLADALKGQKEQLLLAHSFVLNKNEAEDNRRQVILDGVVDRLYRKSVMQRAWNAWRASLQNKWKGSVEKACKKRAEEVCHQMADQYDARIATLEETIRRLREDSRSYKEDRDDVAAKARKALMHGVSVLTDEVKRFPDTREGTEKALSRVSIGRDSRSQTSADTQQSRSRGSADTQQSRSRGSGESRPADVPKGRVQSIGAGPLPSSYKVVKNNEAKSGSDAGSEEASVSSSSSGSLRRASSRNDRKQR